MLKSAGPRRTRPRKRERIELRTTAEEKRLLVSAAAQEQLDVTGFVLRAAIPAAQEALERASRVRLSERDRRRVLELLAHPPEPSARLKRAAQAFEANQKAVSRKPNA